MTTARSAVAAGGTPHWRQIAVGLGPDSLQHGNCPVAPKPARSGADPAKFPSHLGLDEPNAWHHPSP